MLQNNFNLAYTKTSLQERKVIDGVEGPVQLMVPVGTRTTGILALRIGKILLHTRASPGNILCFTGTESSVMDLQKRLEQLIGADASEVKIYTFHSFGRQVLQDTTYLQDDKKPAPISTLESIQLLKNLVAGFPKDHPLKRYRSDVFHEISNLKNLFSFMKREARTAESLHQTIDTILAGLPPTGETNTLVTGSQPGKQKEMIEKLRAGINEFDQYQSLLQKNNRYDTDDLIYLVIRAFEENTDLLSWYRKKFLYLQVNEYNGISQPADQLLQLLIGKNENPNVLLVNFDEQNRVGFQEIHTIHLPVAALACSSDWITIRLTRLNSTVPGKILFNQPVITSYHSVSEEIAGIAHQVNGLLHENIDPSKIAIICLEDEYSAALERYFILDNTPFFSKRKINILVQPFVKKIIQLLRYISYEQDIPYSGDDLLFEILHFDFFKVPALEIARLSVEVNSRRYSKTPTAIRELLMERSNAPAKDLFDTGIDKHLKAVGEILEKLIATTPHISLRQLFETMIHNLRLLPYIDQSKDSSWLMQLLSALDDFIKSETTHNPYLTLNELMEVIDLMEKEELPLAMCSCSGTANGVYISKATDGEEQEFDYVLIAGANASPGELENWFNCSGQLRETFFSSCLGSDRESGERVISHLIDAPQPVHLFITYAKYDQRGKELAPAKFVSNLVSLHALPVKAIELTGDQLKQHATSFQTKQLPKIMPLEEAFIIPILKKFVMNVSALNSYLNCPLDFFYKNILRVPTGKCEAMEFGSAVHYALEKLFKKMSAGDVLPAFTIKQANKPAPFPSASEMVEDFRWYMQRHRAHFTKESFDRRIRYGRDVLQNYYNQYINSWNKVVSVERNIRGITVNGVPLKGKLDKLEFNGKEVIIVDYKSGDIEKAWTKMKPPLEDDPNGGDYWRQAVFYTILLENYTQKDWRVVSTEFDFIEPDKKGEYHKEKIAVHPADVATVVHQLTEVWHKIQAREFYTGCGRQECHWCNFVRENRPAVATQD